MKKNILCKVLYEQQKDFLSISELIEREKSDDLLNLLRLKMPIIIAGVRRCGKSSLLKLIFDELKLHENNFLYINFNDERFLDFEVSNFQDILDYLEENEYSKDVCFFIDEIQEVFGWEKWIDRIKDKYKIIITGSNSHLLSSEISTVLTGRSININLFPFSFGEFLNYKKVDLSDLKLNSKKEIKVKKEFKKYFFDGGFPKMVLENNNIVLRELYENILYRDVINRFNVNLNKTIKEISLYLQSNVATDISLRTLSKISGVKNLETLKNIVDSFEGSFLFFFTSKFDYSVKKQVQNPKKIYSIDNGLARSLSFRFSENLGNLLENLVAIELRRRDQEIYYFREKGECDFVVRDGADIVEAVQVCYDLDDKNRDREVDGLVEACSKFGLKKGLILTMDQDKEIVFSGVKIMILPVWKWLLG